MPATERTRHTCHNHNSASQSPSLTFHHLTGRKGQNQMAWEDTGSVNEKARGTCTGNVYSPTLSFTSIEHSTMPVMLGAQGVFFFLNHVLITRHPTIRQSLTFQMNGHEISICDYVFSVHVPRKDKPSLINDTSYSILPTHSWFSANWDSLVAQCCWQSSLKSVWEMRSLPSQPSGKSEQQGSTKC